MLGAYGRSDWADLSDYVVHFSKGSDGADGYHTMLEILGQRRLLRGPHPFGAARRVPEIAESQRAVCFSEVPLGFLSRLSQRRGSPYGIAFRKRFLLAHAGAPLWYLEQGTPHQAAMQALIDHARARLPDASDAIWELTPFIDFPSGPESPYQYDFRWEREWRTTTDLAFNETDVAFLVIPERLHTAAWSFFHEAVNENIGPGYFCPYIDADWSVEQVQEAMAKTGVQ